MPELCRHDMNPEWCSICLHGLAQPAPSKPTVVASFSAKYDGHCDGCNLPIHVGQWIHRMSDARYVHQGHQ